MDEARLFDEFRSRPSEKALVDLLRNAQDTVYTLCFHILRHPQNAEDAAQRVFLELLDALPRIADAAHFRRWIHKASFHVALDMKRRQETQRAHASELARRWQATPDEDAQTIHEHLELLEGDLRAMVVEHYFDRKPLEAMASERGCSVVAVWKKLQKALDRLKRSLVRTQREGAALGLANYLDHLSPIPAPTSLITREIEAKVSQAVAKASAAQTLILGGIALKTKTVVAALVIALSALSSVPVMLSHRRGAEQQPIVKAREKRPLVGANEAAPADLSRDVVVSVEIPEPVVDKFATSGEFYMAFRKSLYLLDDLSRWRALRSVGFPLTDEQFRDEMDRVGFKRGTASFVNILQQRLLEAWAKRDPHQAAEFFRALPGSLAELAKRDLLNAVLSTWAAADSREALKFAEKLPEGDGRRSLANHIAAIDHPAQFAHQVLGMEKEERWAALEYLAASWAQVDPRETLRWGASLPGELERGHFLEIAVARWAAIDLGAAAAWAGSRQELLRIVIQTGASANPQDAAGMLRLLDSNHPNTANAVEAIGRAWVERDVTEGLKFLKSSGAVGELTLMRAAELDPRQTLAWVTQNPEGEHLQKMLESVFRGWALSDRATPEEALAIIRTMPEQGRTRHIQSLVYGMAESDPAAAAAFAVALPPEAVSYDSLGERWAYRDMATASSWARGLTERTNRDEAIAGILRLAKTWDPPLAVSLAAEISRPESRRDTFQSILRSAQSQPPKGISLDQFIRSTLNSWAQKDPVEAAQWEAGSGTRH
jgi:RNA polymerase sigma factor (sigma-70 family)